MARPKKEDVKSEVITVRLSKYEKKRLEEIVKYEGYGTAANYIRECLKRDLDEDDESPF